MTAKWTKESPGRALRYVGPTALTVRGPLSGRLYRFDRPGAVITPDPRDQRALATIPALRVVERS